MGATTNVFTTVYVVWIVASMAALAWAYRHNVKAKFCGNHKRG